MKSSEGGPGVKPSKSIQRGTRRKSNTRDSQALQQWKSENPGYPSKQVVRGTRRKPKTTQKKTGR